MGLGHDIDYDKYTAYWSKAVGEEMHDQWGNLLGVVVDYYFVQNTDNRIYPALEFEGGFVMDVTYFQLED